MSGPRRYHYHAAMAEPCVVPEEPRSWRREALAIAGGVVFLLALFAVILAIVFAAGGSVRPL